MVADEPSLYSRREKLSLQYAIRFAAKPSSPAHEVTFPPNNVDLYEQKPNAIKSFGTRISPLLESANIKPQNIEKHFTPNIPAWCMKQPEILFDLHSGKHYESNPQKFKDDFRKLQSRHRNYQQIYTDGSKDDSKAGCAVISDNHSNMQRIPDNSSIFTAEAKAVDLALDFISTFDANNKFIIFPDSLSVLKAMNHTSSKNPLIQKLLHILKDDFRKMQSRYKNYQNIYTDGSKEDSKVGCAVISDNHSNMQRIPDDSSIFSAEAKAIDLALDFISTCDANNKFIIFSDSLSVLKAMNHTSSKNPKILKLLEKCHELLAYKEIVLCWIPSHIGIQGNEMVDKQAKTSLSLEPTSFKISFSYFKPSINIYKSF